MSNQLSNFDSILTKASANNSDIDGDDAKSTCSSYPFSSPNPSEHDDHTGDTASGSHSESKKGHKKRRHNDLTFMGATNTGSSAASANRLSFPLSERQQMALVMQLSTQEQANDHPKSPASSTPTSTSKIRGKLARVHRRNERGETLLHLAAKRGECRNCLELIEDGADVNCVDYAGWTPLHEACNQGWYKTAKILLEHGANVNVCGLDDDTPLHDAAVSGDLKLVKLLLRHGADIYKPNKLGKRPIDTAEEDPEVKLVMMQGYDEDKSKQSLSPASERCNELANNTSIIQRNENNMELISVNTDAEEKSEHRSLDITPPIDHLTLSVAHSPIASPIASPSVDDTGEPSPIPKQIVGLPEMAENDCLNNTYASTESESEQRLIVVEEDMLMSSDSTKANLYDDQSMVSPVSRDQTKETLTIIRPSTALITTSLTSLTPDIVVTTTLTSSTEESMVQKTSADLVTSPRTRTDTALHIDHLENPKRDLTYTKRPRRFEADYGSGFKNFTARQTGAHRGRKRKNFGTRSKDVYEFHSSESEDEATRVAGRRKFAKLTPTKEIGSTSSSLLAEPIAVTPKLIRTISPSNVEPKKSEALEEVSDVLQTKLSVETPLLPKDEVTLGEPTKIRPKEDRPAVQRADDDGYGDSEAETRVQSSSQSVSSLSPSAATATIPTTSSGSVMGFKKRLLNIGKRRYQPDGQTTEQLKMREAHIENIVASIGSGFGDQAESSSEEQQERRKQVLTSEPTARLLRKEKEYLYETETSTPTSSSAGNNEPDEDSREMALSPKVPPLKLVLAGRSASEEESSTNQAKDSGSGRTYVVRSRANSPFTAGERRNSDVGEPSFQRDDLKKQCATVQSCSTASTAAGGNGGESSQRVTRSQVRLHGAQLDLTRSMEEAAALAIHPRKRKLRQKTIEPIMTDRPLLPVVSSALASIAVKSSYEAFRDMRNTIESRWKEAMTKLSSISINRPIPGYEHYLLNKKSYLLQGRPDEELVSNDIVNGEHEFPIELKELKKKHKQQKLEMQQQHRVERERLITSCECEAIRNHNRCALGFHDPPISVMRMLRDDDMYNPLQLDKEVPFSVIASREPYYSSLLTDISARFNKTKRELIGRQKLESQCLFATQTQEWDARSKSLLLQRADERYSTANNVELSSVFARMAEFAVSTLAYCKMILHALKYPHCTISGLLIGEKKKGAGGGPLLIIDAVPLFHRWHGLTSMLEVALCQIDLYCQHYKKNCTVVGYYQANERIKEIAPDAAAFKTVEKLQSFYPDAVLVMLNNSNLAGEHLNYQGGDSESCYRVYCFHDGRWKPKETQKFFLEDDEKTLATLSASIQSKICRELIDFDNHMDDISLDFWNCHLNDKIQGLSP